MPVAFRANGTTAASATADITPGLPAGYATGDILLLLIESDVAGSNWQLAPATLAAGWEIIYDVDTTGVRLGIAWLRAPNTSVVAPTVLRNTTNHVLGVVQAYSGAIASGNALATFDGLGRWGLAASSNIGTTAIGFTPPSGTDSSGELVVALVAASTAVTVSAWGNGSLTSFTERLDINTALGNAGTLATASGLRTTSGAVTATTATMSATSNYVAVIFGIREVGPFTRGVTETAAAVDAYEATLYARWDYLPTVISQYANSPILLSLIDFASQWFDQDYDVNEFYLKMWNIATAEGYGLDVWGRIVGVGRTLQVATSTYFEFQQQAQVSPLPFGGGPFFAGTVATTNHTLSDAAFRQLILAKALSNICGGSITAINQILMFLFPGLGNCYVTDGGNMTMTYTFGAQLSAVQLAIISQSGILPRPAGVSASIVQL